MTGEPEDSVVMTSSSEHTMAFWKISSQSLRAPPANCSSQQIARMQQAKQQYPALSSSAGPPLP